MNQEGRLILEDGTVMDGMRFGACHDTVVEVVFNTSMVGYQEILSDPSYTDQGVIFTYPLIGNYGMAGEDYETVTPSIGALLVREVCDHPSSFRMKETLEEVMIRYEIPGLSGLDTRALTRHIREMGSMRGLLTSPEVSAEEGILRIKNTPVPHDAVARVSTKKVVHYDPNIIDRGAHGDLTEMPPKRDVWEPSQVPHIVAVDCGMKQNIVRSFLQRGASVSVVPWNTTAEEILALRPDGVFLSNGPGDPADVPETEKTVRMLHGKVPIFGICLGHQILARSYGAKTYKLKFGHRGGNHPVKELQSGKVAVTSQNHSYAVAEESLAGTPLLVTHRNLLDGTIEGMMVPDERAFSVQFHPESAPGPEDSAQLFDQFLRVIQTGGANHA